MNVQCTSSVCSERGDILQAGEVVKWAESLPPGAHITAMIKDLGTQRDPEPTLVGLRAAWSEERPLLSEVRA